MTNTFMENQISTKTTDFFYNHNKQLVFANQVIADLTKPDQNPFYLYSKNIIQDQLNLFQNAITAAVAPTVNHKKPQIFFAMKSNPSASFLQFFSKKGLGIDVVSLGEIKKTLATGHEPNKIVYSGVGKRISEIKNAIQLGVRQLNVESIEELQRIVQLTSQMSDPLNPQNKLNIVLRVNPEVDVRTHPYIATGLKENKFGIEMSRIAEAADIFKSIDAKNIQWAGLSLHIGSQLKEFESLRVSIQKIKNLYLEMQQLGFPLKIFDVGGGLGIVYEGDRQEDEKFLKLYATVLKEELSDFPAQIQLEPGRCLTARCGALITEVQYRKWTTHKTFIVVSSGMNHLMRPTLYEAYHRIFPLIQRTDSEVVDIVGPVCESSDFLAKDRRLTTIQAGDFLAIADAGAYGASMASGYNSFDFPDEVWI